MASTETEPAGATGDAPEEFRARVRELLVGSVFPLLEQAEAVRRFPRRAVEIVAGAGIFRERWEGADGDTEKALIFSEELGRSALGGIGVGLIVQTESVVPTLRRFGKTDEARRWMEAVLDGEAVGSVAASEQQGGSDLSAVRTSATPEGDGWRIQGNKWYSGPAGAADIVLVLCRLGDEPGMFGPKLGIAVVEKQHIELRRLETSGCRSLETCRLAIDGVIPDSLLLVQEGLGLHALNWGLTYERLSSAAQTLGGADTAIRLATTHMRRRQQFGAPLFEHQALRMRLAGLAGEVLLARNGLYRLAAEAQTDQQLMRQAAAAKATTAILAERVISECAHLFGGAGFLEDETPFPRVIRDLRLSRLGGGSNEVLWELFAQGLESDDELYERLISIEEVAASDDPG